MVRYLADLLGWRSTDNRTEGTTPGGHFTGLGGAGTARGKTNLLDPDPTFYDDTGAGEGTSYPTTIASIGGFGSGMGQPFRTPVSRGVAQLAGVGAPLQAREPPPGGAMPPLNGRPQVAPLPMAPDVPMAGTGRQPQAGAMTQSPPRPDFLAAKGGGSRDLLSGAGRWLNAPIMGQEHGTSRMMAIGQLLSGVGAGMANGGGLGGGIQGLNQSIAGLRESEQKRIGTDYEREMKRLELELKRKELERGGDPKVVGSDLVSPTGQLLYRGEAADKHPTSAFAAYWQSLPAEQRTPENAQAWEERQQSLKDAMSPAERERLRLSEESGRRSEESLALAREASARAAAAAERTAAQPTEATLRERDRALVNRVDEIVESQGWDAVRADDRRAYERVYRELATPKRTVDPLTGAVTEIQPDVTDLPPPPNYGGAAPGATPATPTPGVTQPTAVLGRETITKAKEMMGLRERAVGNLARVRDLLDEAGSVGRFAGDSSRRIEVAASAVVTLMGELQNAGVLQPSDIERFTRELGNITGLAAAGAEATGLDTTRAALDELWQRIDRESKTKLPKANSEAEADKMPPGVPYLMPDGTIGSN